MSASDEARSELSRTSVAASIMEVNGGTERIVDRVTSATLVFVQGSEAFATQMQGLFEGLKVGGFFCVTPFSAASKLAGMGGKRYKVTHRQFGGVTTGTWELHSSVSLAGLKSTSVKRRLGHVLSSTEKGRQLEGCVDEYVTNEDRLPVQRKRVEVLTPSVFAKGARVLREVTPKELMVCFDIEEGSQKALLGGTRGEDLSKEFVMEAPLKVLCGLGKWIQHVVGSIEVMTDIGPDPCDQNSPHCEEEGAKKQREGGSGIKRPGGEVSDPMVAKRPKGNASPELVEAKEPSQIATKSDDAPVDVEEWDRWSVDHYVQPHADVGEPLVCVRGSYCPESHGRLFDALRRLLIRRVRLNALRGLIKYMRNKHGARLVRTEVRYRKKKKKGQRERRKKRSRKRKLEDMEIKDGKPSSPSRYNLDEGKRIIFGAGTVRSFRVSEWALKKKLKGELKKGCEDDTLLEQRELHLDAKVGSDAVGRLANASWWNWDNGSTLMFWRWPRRWHKAIRDGTKLFVKEEKLPHFFKRQRWPPDPTHTEKMGEKVGKVRSRGYISPGKVNSLTGFFAVPKGSDDIRIVYDATACGLNDALWSPSFFLPTIDSVLRNASNQSWYGDIDLGEMFLNYFLDEKLRPFAGVDVSRLGAKKLERWERTLMGLRSSPYVCTQAFGWGEDFIRGRRKDVENIFRWDSVRLNLPGDEGYDPTLPWVYKWDSLGNKMPGYFGSYIDDIRTLDGSEEGCRRVSRRVASWVNYLGQQDAARKRRPPSQEPGAWAGAMCVTKNDGLYVTCTQKKWDRAQEIVNRWFSQVVEDREVEVEAKQMEKDVGFLVHLSRTFPATFPYLKGFYLTLNSWRKGRNDEGWKYSMSEWKAALDLEDDLPSYKVQEVVKERVPGDDYEERPRFVKSVPRLQADLLALKELYGGDKPSLRLVRGDKVSSCKLAFGDASGGGFGSSWELNEEEEEDSGRIAYRFGTWEADTSSESSNYRELRNLVDTLEVMAEDGSLAGTELFIFTDNSTAESAFAKGSSSSKKLFEMVLRIRQLEMSSSCKIHISHVAGTRMIDQGSDGLSRGNLTEGVMKGLSMSSFAPINKSAFDRSPGLRAWFKSWVKGGTFLTPEDWFVLGHEIREEEVELNSEGIEVPVTRPGTFIWSPPPAVARTAVEELRRSRHKSHNSTHVMVIPKLFSTEWRKELYKAADVVLTLPVGHPLWPDNMHEPLTIAILFPFLNHRPWELRRTPKLLELASALRQVWESRTEPEGPILRELWSLPGSLANLSPSLARKVLYGKLD